MFWFISISFLIGAVYFIYILSPALFWIIFCLIGFFWFLLATDNSNDPNVGSHWSHKD